MTSAPTPPGAVVLLGAMLGGRYPELVPAALRRGLTVLGIDTDTARARRFDQARRENPEHPLAGLAEMAWLPGERHEEIVQQVLDWDAEHRVAAVVPFGEDYVEATALVADLLGLPAPGLRAGRVCRNKLLQRRYLAAQSPRSVLLPAADRADRADRAAAWDTFPAVVKPLDGQASSGVERVDDLAQLAAVLAERDEAEALLLEELVAGHEVSVESLVQHGVPVFAAVTGKRTNEGAGPDEAARFFVELGHTVPDPELSPAARRAVLDANAAVLARLDFRDGIAHAEYRVTAEGEVRLMEIAARAAGDNILTLYHLATGAPLEEALLGIALGEPTTYPEPRRFVRQVYPEHTPGVLLDVTAPGLDTEVSWLAERWMWPPVKPLSDEPGAVHMIVAGRARGDRLTGIKASSDRSAMYVIDAPTPTELDELQARVDAALTVEVDPNG
ncbi:ATP-grasp domain-containing protein [Kitasatospora sp. NPDC094015]|uniref:ATP-grasp domain-containing protein n=1 Tax=Kitasatospora sp. NPDC094015 TaxID=3155205 RepID=UPI00332180E1